MIEVEQTVYFTVDVTDWLDPGREYSPAELAQVAEGVGDYCEWSPAKDEIECNGGGAEGIPPAEGYTTPAAQHA